MERKELESKFVKATMVIMRGKDDEFHELKCVGYDNESAYDEAINELKYSCCSDFTRPSSCGKGIEVDYFEVEALPINEDDDIDDIANVLGLEYMNEFIASKGGIYALKPNYMEYYTGGKIVSDEVRNCSNWNEVKKLYLGI